MDNYLLINNSRSLDGIFRNIGNKLVIIYYYSKHNNTSIQLANELKKIAAQHSASFFCSVDIDHFNGESRFVDRQAKVPSIQGFYKGNTIGSTMVATEIELNDIIGKTEIYVRDLSLRENQSANLSNYQYSHQPNYAPLQPPPQYPFNGYQINDAIRQSNLTESGLQLPSMQQMQQMFKIFQMLQKMGVLLTDEEPIIQDTLENEKNTSPDGAIMLSNGDRIVPLGNGKYGVIEKK